MTDILKYIVDWEEYSRTPITADQLNVYHEYLNWHWISLKQPLTERQIIQYIDYIDWELLAYNPCLTDQMIRKFKDYVKCIY